jgi:hypothetical protein
MSKLDDYSDAHIRVYKLEAAEVAKLAEKGSAIRPKALEKRGAAEAFSVDTFERTDPNAAPRVPFPDAVGDLVFPRVIHAPRFFCFCIGYIWCLEWINGQLRYVLKCRYYCIPTFPISVAG